MTKPVSAQLDKLMVEIFFNYMSTSAYKWPTWILDPLMEVLGMAHVLNSAYDNKVTNLA